MNGMSTLLQVKTVVKINWCYPLPIFQLIGFFIVFIAITSPDAQEVKRVGTHEFAFLSLPGYARPAGLAGAYTTLAEGIDALTSNPAGLANQGRKKEVSFGFKKNVLDINTGEISYPIKAKNGIWYAASINYSHFGTIQEINEKATFTGKEFTPSNHTLSLTAAKELNNKIRTGVTVKLPTEYLGDFEGTKLAVGWAIDAGIQYQPNTKRFSFGAAVLNAGRKELAHIENGEKGNLLPLELRTGMIVNSLRRSNTLLAVDINVPYHNHPYLSGGFEYGFTRTFIARLGSRINIPELKTYFRQIALNRNIEETAGKNVMKLAAGFTVKTKRIGIDYAAQYWHLLGVVHWVTLKWRM